MRTRRACCIAGGVITLCAAGGAYVLIIRATARGHVRDAVAHAAAHPVQDLTGRVTAQKSDRERASEAVVSRMSRLAGGGFRWADVLALGDVYARGAYPHFRPNEDRALDCYRVCARSHTDPEAASLACQRYIELRTAGQIVDAGDRAGTALPEGPCRTACLAAEAELTRPGPHMRAAPKTACVVTFAAPAPLQPLVATTLVPVHRRDGQNVHDHSVTADTRANLESLPSLASTSEASDAVTEVTKLIASASGLDDDTRADAMQVLGSLGTDDTWMGASQTDALARTWKRIAGIENGQERENVRETLVRQLASGVEHGAVVCSTGKISRILGALDGTGCEGHREARPMWAVRQEIAALAARTRDKFEDSEGAKLEFRKSAIGEYVDSLGLSESVMEPIIAEFEEHL